MLEISFFVLIFGLFNAEAARILAVYPCPSISHQVVFRPLTSELLKLGHEVIVVTPDPMFPKDGAPPNLTEIDIHESYEMMQKTMAASVSDDPESLFDHLNVAVAMNEFINTQTEFVVKTKQFQDLLNEIKTKKFDLLMIEALFTPMLALTDLTKAPTILVSSLGPFFGNYDMMGAPTTPLLYHHVFSNRLYNLTLWEKASELYNKLQIDFNNNMIEKSTNDLLKRIFGSDIPPLNILRDNVDMLFVNLNPIWEGNYPVPPNVIHMGGLHQKPPKPLPQNLQQYLDASENGVIYFSFGTNVNTSLLPIEKMAVFQKVFAELPYNVLWKMNNDEFPVKSDNFKIFKWLPQADLLRHPKIKMFITQGGLQSTDEAITAGVPLLGVPIMGDQRYNVEKYEHHKIGVKLMFQDVTETNLKNAILELVENQSYRDNIVRLRTRMQDQPQTPLERAIWWIEYVLRHGGAKHLRAPAANLSWIEYYEVELVSYLFVFLLFFISLTFLIIRYLVSFVLKVSSIKGKLKKL